jgi:hypothetical protein
VTVHKTTVPSSLTITSNRIAVTSSPGHAYHITSVIDRSDGVELLWQPGCASPRVLGNDLGLAGGASVEISDQDLLLGGWILMFPSVGVPGESLPISGCMGRPLMAWQRRAHTQPTSGAH